MVLSTEWCQLEIVDLINDGNSSLGFMLVGGKSTGVVIKALIPGGLAERDGRLSIGDHVLVINDVNLRGFSSEQVATVLRQCGSQVRLVVARPVDPSSSDYQTLASHAPIVPTKLLTDPEELDRTLLQTAAIAPVIQQAAPVISEEMIPAHIEVVAVNNSINLCSQNVSTLVSPSSPPIASSPDYDPEAMENYIDTPETETFDVELRKNVYGLGITVAGYVCHEEDLSGIFVKSIIEGSAAEMSGKIQINDRIIAVDGKNLSGVSNHQAVEILRSTGIAVTLTLERFLRGRKYEHLQVALVDSNAPPPQNSSLPPSPSITTLSLCPAKSDADSENVTEGAECDCNVEAEIASCTTVDSNIFGLENGSRKSESSSTESTPTPTTSLDPVLVEWKAKINDAEIIVAEVNKLAGLGISLEGTVDVEGGVEKRPHHYIRSILAEGPVGREGSLQSGDELLQVNEHKLQGLRHTDVVKILKELPSKVKVICARGPAPTVIDTSQSQEAFDARSILAGGFQSLLTKAQSESSIYTSSTATLTDQQRSKSLEQVSDLALWSNEVIYVEIEKTERGFGFSILDYQDPLDTDGIVIVVRGIISGGSAEKTNAIFPGDRLVSVNEHNLHGSTLDEAVAILKGIPIDGNTTKIGLCRPLADCCSEGDSPIDETPT